MPSTCQHCGSTFEPDAAGGAAEYCSPGCAAVHARIVREGLGRFYVLRGGRAAPVGEAALRPHDFTWLEEAVAAAEATGGRSAELVLDVQGISCVGCVWLIERLFHRRPGARRLDVNAARGRLWWQWERGRFEAVAFARELQDFGYQVGPVGEPESAHPSHGLRLRLGLSAAFAMNTMLFVLPGYLGLEATSEFAPVFERLAAAFATAGLLTGGSYFARRAWAGLRLGAINLDVPITLGLALGYGGSVFGWLGGHPDLVYFDFVAVFSFLMLVGRWTQEVAVERNRHQLLALSREPQEVTVEPQRGEGSADANVPLQSACIRVPVARLQRGQVFRLRAGQVAPVAATLCSQAATFTTEWINGETDPRDIGAGQRVAAGSASVGLEPIRLRAEEAWAESALVRLLEATGAQGFRHVLAERIVRTYLMAIVALALAGGAGWWWATGDTLKALHVTIAVLVASCPCGIGVAFPLAEEMAVAALRRHGVFVRELSLFPRLQRIRQIVFDKTGTLTLETSVLQNPEALAALALRERAALWRLVEENHHPTARAVHEALALGGLPIAGQSPTGEPSCEGRGAAEGAGVSNPGSVSDNQDSTIPAGMPRSKAEVFLPAASAGQARSENRQPEIAEVIGQGVVLRAADGVWSLGRPGFDPENPMGSASSNRKWAIEKPNSADAEFARDGRVLAQLHFAESARADARRELAALQREGRTVSILSGDRPEKVAALAAALGVPVERALGGLTPEAKRDWLRQHDAAASLMLGDGANDSLAFEVAGACGTPVIHRGMLERKSDFYFLGRGLGGVRRLFAVAELRRRTVRRVFAFAVAYNVGTVVLALAGGMNPLVAAVAMPVSSLVSVALASGGMRLALRG